ncbi:MAG: DNA topoisomerase III [Verrucomicrobiota bacterium]
MGKKLIIAEKPSVAQDLQRALGKLPNVGKFTKEKDYFESEHVVISSALGHLVELCMPNDQTGTSLKWNFDHLPIIPGSLKLQPIEKTKSRFNLLKRLMKRKDVDEIINACDAGREGELIFRYLVDIAGVNKPNRRMWMQSMTEGSIVQAWQSLRSDSELQPLANAARCRSESDWLVGINGTRAMTAYNSKYGGFSKTPVGRVQTPTLAIMVERESRIQSFEPRPFWEIHAEFSVHAGDFPSVWFEEGWKKGDDELDRADRIWDEATAEAIKKRCEGKVAQIEEKRKPSKQAPPLLYDLTSLQREANNRFGLSASRTLQIAQALYERHKVLTYPRTDSRYLPEDYIGVAKGTLEKIKGGSPILPSAVPACAGKAISNGWVTKHPRIFDNRKVSDHFAIIPTGHFSKKLDDYESRVYHMVVQRFVAVFFPSAEFEMTTRISRIRHGDGKADAFKANGKVMRVPGWMEVYGGSVGGKDKILIPVVDGEEALAKELRKEEKVTKPPPRYSEATILSAMEGAGKLVDDEELAAAMSERGLGTPATRAQTIERLLNEKYIIRHEKELSPTTAGMRLISELSEIGVDILCSPEMTGQWEHKLKRMEHGELPRDGFMGEIRDLTKDVVERARLAAKQAKEAHYDPLDLPCPTCGTQPLKQDQGSFRCTGPGCKFAVWKVIASRPMELSELEQLIKHKFVGPLQGFRSKFGDEFEAALEFDADGKIKFITQQSQDAERRKQQELESLAEAPVIASCPLCESTVHEFPEAFACRNNILGDCKARLNREYCQRRLSREDAVEFFETGKSPLIEDFISKRGRPFKANLLMNREGGKRFVEYAFPPREAKKKGSTKKKSAKKAATKKKTA